MFAEPMSLSNFIEMPSYRCEGKILSDGIANLTAALRQENGPNKVMTLIQVISTSEEGAPASYLLADLAKKITKQKDPIADLTLLYEQCSERIVALCIYNQADLDRCVGACPSHVDLILRVVAADEQKMRQILNGFEHQSAEKTLADVVAKYPAYAEQFTACHHRSVPLCP